MKLPIMLLFLLLLSSSALAQLSCTIQMGGICAGATVLKLTSQDDAHAYLPNNPTTTQAWICCIGVPDLTVRNTYIQNQFVIGLDTPADSHVSIVRGDYGSEVYLDSATYDVTCGEELLPAECAAYQTCLYEVHGGSADDHVFSCGGSASASKRQVCCSAVLLAGPNCVDSDGGEIYGVEGITTDNDGSDTDSCLDVTSTLTEWRCNAATNTRESVSYVCPNGCAADGSGACEPAPQPPGFPCITNELFWTDNNYENAITEAAINFPVSALITGQGCADTTADFTIYDSLGLGVPVNFEPVNYAPDGDIWYAAISWTPIVAGDYYFNVNSASALGLSLSKNSLTLTVTGPCVATEPAGDCPADWSLIPNPNDQDLDCDGIRDCFDGWIGNAACPVDPKTGVPVCQTGCEGQAWDCSGTAFSECFPDPVNQDYYVQSREGECVKNPAYLAYCPPPSDLRGCIVEEDFPVFSLMNLLAVSMILIGFYAVRRR